jgi:hypothetical protein
VPNCEDRNLTASHPISLLTHPRSVSIAKSKLRPIYPTIPSDVPDVESDTCERGTDGNYDQVVTIGNHVCELGGYDISTGSPYFKYFAISDLLFSIMINIIYISNYYFPDDGNGSTTSSITFPGPVRFDPEQLPATIFTATMLSNHITCTPFFYLCSATNRLGFPDGPSNSLTYFNTSRL